MDILNRINEAIHEFMHETGKTPTVIYLGRLDYGELVNAVDKGGLAYKADDGEKKSVAGLEIHTVDDERHLRVGI